MQINRPSILSFPSTAAPAASTKPAPATAPSVLTDTVAAAPAQRGVVYTGSKDLSNMTLENQLEYGRNQGVFTKISLHKDRVLVAGSNRDHSPANTGFVASAVTTMQDFQEGIALLKQHSAEPNSKAMEFLYDKLRGLQNAASKLNVFA